MVGSVLWLLLGEIMRRIVATVVTLLFTLGIGALAAPAQAADWVTVVVSVDHADGTDATQSCVQLFSVEDAQWFELSCSASGGNHSGSVPEGEYRIFYRWDEQYNDQWQWYVGPTSSTLFQHEATIVAVSEGADHFEWRVSDGLVPFSDVPVGHPFHYEISNLVALGVIGGYDDGTFRSTAPVTRQAFAAFIARVGWPDGEYPDVHSKGFTDVPDTHPFATEINLLADYRVIEGYDDNTFRPTAPVSRQAAAAFFARSQHNSFQAYTAPGTATFSDVAADHLFFRHIEWTVSGNVVNGYDDGTYRPTATITRQAAAAMLYRFVYYQCCSFNGGVV